MCVLPGSFRLQAHFDQHFFSWYFNTHGTLWYVCVYIIQQVFRDVSPNTHLSSSHASYNKSMLIYHYYLSIRMFFAVALALIKPMKKKQIKNEPNSLPVASSKPSHLGRIRSAQRNQSNATYSPNSSTTFD